MSEKRSGRKGGDEGFLNELSSFRREAMKVSEDDMRSWRKEVLKKREGEEPQSAPGVPEPKKPGRKKRSSGRRRPNPMIPFVVLIVAGAGLFLRPAKKKPRPTATPSVIYVVREVTPDPLPTPAPATAPSFRVETGPWIAHSLLAAWESEWAAPRIRRHFPGEPLAATGGPWTDLTGDAVAFHPWASLDDAWWIAARRLATDRLPSRSAVYARFARILGEAEEDRVKALLTDPVEAARVLGSIEAFTPVMEVEVQAVSALVGGDATKAHSVLDAGIRAHPEAAALRYRKAWIHRLQRDAAGMHRVLGELEKASPEEGGVRVILASMALESGDRWAAKDQLEPLLEKVAAEDSPYPGTQRAALLGLYADILNTPKGSLEETRRYLDRSAELMPEGLWCHLAQARLARKQGRRLAAEDRFREYLATVPSPVIRRELGDYLEDEGSLALAFAEMAPLKGRGDVGPDFDERFGHLLRALNRDDIAAAYGLSVSDPDGT